MVTRNGTTCAVAMMGINTIKVCVGTHEVPALSSGEDECYAVTRGGVEGLGLRSSLLDIGEDSTLELLTDSSAARGMAMRQGVGKVRHLAGRFLWVQAYVKKGLFTVKKERGEDNPADIGAKHAPTGTMDKHMAATGLVVRAGRVKHGPQLTVDVEAMSRNSVLRIAVLMAMTTTPSKAEGAAVTECDEPLHFWVMAVGIIMLMGVAFIMGMKYAARATISRRDTPIKTIVTRQSGEPIEVIMARRSGVDGRYKYHTDEKCYGLRRSQLVKIDMCQWCKRKKA